MNVYSHDRAGFLTGEAWSMSRELRKPGWRADALNWDATPGSQMFYHGEDFRVAYGYHVIDLARQMAFYLAALTRYDIFHFPIKIIMTRKKLPR